MTDTTSSKIHSFDGIHCAQNYDMANLSMVEVDGGYVAIDAGTSPRICREVDQRWQELSGGSALALILTHSHGDHNGGASVYSDQGLPIWGHKAFLDELEQMQLLPNAFFTRGAKQFGWRLPPEKRDASGVGPPLPLEPGTRSPIVIPNHWVDQEHTEIIGNETFVMHFAPGETHDHLLIWLPERKTLFAADNIYRAFPNLYAIRGVPPRPIRGWIDSLDHMRRLDPAPERLILGHGDPVEGQAGNL